MSQSIVISGLGLIGGSAGMALRARGWQVSYVDPHVELDDGRRFGAAEERVDLPGEADVILLATPVDVAVSTLSSLRTSSVVTSACSIMAPLRAVSRDNFVAGHPMAGSQERGLSAARADLFEGKRWFVDARDERVDRMIRDCGATPDLVDAAEHDRAVALTSHLPQILSTALAAHLASQPDVLRFAGSGLATFLRLAGSDPDVWVPVIDSNRDNLASHADAVAAIVREIVEGDPTEAFRRAQSLWRRL